MSQNKGDRMSNKLHLQNALTALGKSQASLARDFGRDPSTISRLLKKSGDIDGAPVAWSTLVMSLLKPPMNGRVEQEVSADEINDAIDSVHSDNRSEHASIMSLIRLAIQKGRVDIIDDFIGLKIENTEIEEGMEMGRGLNVNSLANHLQVIKSAIEARSRVVGREARLSYENAAMLAVQLVQQLKVAKSHEELDQKSEAKVDGNES